MPLADARNAFKHPTPEVDLTWENDAACKGMGVEVFFDYTRTLEARAVCAGCPVARECDDAALTRREAWGVWGGRDEDERRSLLRRNRRRAS